MTHVASDTAPASVAVFAGLRGRAQAALAPDAGTLNRIAGRLLNAAASSWCWVAVLGQLLFAAYVSAFYGGAAARGQYATWNKVLHHGYVAGDTLGNASIGLHLLLTVVVIVSGALQLAPWLRRRTPHLHRWNGRVYLSLASLLAAGGAIMIWTRGTPAGLPMQLGGSLNAVLILAFAVMAWRHARARRFDRHRRWALRLFLAVSGVWFFRIGLMAWVVANQGPVGFDPVTFRGPFLSFMAFAQYLLPLALLELYLQVQERAGARGRLAMAAGLALLTLLTAAGTTAAFLVMWLPLL